MDKVSTTLSGSGVLDLGKLGTSESPALEVEKIEEVEVAEAPENYCEACEKAFKTPAALKGHNTKTHSE